MQSLGNQTIASGVKIRVLMCYSEVFLPCYGRSSCEAAVVCLTQYTATEGFFEINFYSLGKVTSLLGEKSLFFLSLLQNL